MNRYFLLGLHIISLVLLGFGWFLNMLHIDISIDSIINFNLFNEKRSVVTTLTSLWESKDYWPFLLIFFFGIVIPLVKSGLIFYLLIAKKGNEKIYQFVSAISKWAMADVFAISIFVAFLGAKAMESTTANLEPGFYYFAGYVVLSGMVVMLLGKFRKEQKNISLKD